MKISRLLLATFGSFGCMSLAAWACTPMQQWTFFEFKLAEIPAGQQAEDLRRFGSETNELKRSRMELDERCERLIVMGYADAEEAAIPDLNIDVARSVAVRDFVAREANIPMSLIEIRPMGAKLALIPTPAGVREAQNRAVWTMWDRGVGRWRCDPASNIGFMNTCSVSNLRCYLELTDGTMCNFDGVPDPSPAKYSVDLYGQQLK